MKKFGVFIFCLLLAGCASYADQKPLDPTLGLDPALGQDPAEAQLAEAAVSVSQSLTHLSEIQQAVTPPPPNFQPPDPASYGMANLVSIDWAGPIEPLVTQIGNSTGYTVRVIGNEPAVPIMVYLSEKDTPIGQVLRNAGYQCAEKASIVLFPKTKVIELRYANTQA